jgi:hypothetical protein
LIQLNPCDRDPAFSRDRVKQINLPVLARFGGGVGAKASPVFRQKARQPQSRADGSPPMAAVRRMPLYCVLTATEDFRSDPQRMLSH